MTNNPRSDTGQIQLTNKAAEFAQIQENWPTATSKTATGYQSGSNRDTWRPTLEGRAQGYEPELHQKRPKRDGRSRKRLNPRFVEWLMGWPTGWTSRSSVGWPNFAFWAMVSSRWSRHMRGLFWKWLWTQYRTRYPLLAREEESAA